MAFLILLWALSRSLRGFLMTKKGPTLGRIKLRLWNSGCYWEQESDLAFTLVTKEATPPPPRKLWYDSAQLQG